MEIETKTGSKIQLQDSSKPIDFGRGLLGFDSTDRTVSRHHISFKLNEDRTRVYFEVKGKNPIWVRNHNNNEIKAYRSSEHGEIRSGDSFCVSSKHPVWFNLKKIRSEDEFDHESKREIGYDEAFAEISGVDDDDEIETVDLSHIDPVKEFNFVVMGHEFDCYPKKMIRDIRNWEWFLEEHKEGNDSDEDENSDKKSKKSVRKKRKKGKRGENDDDDEVWTGESEEDAELIKRLRNDPKPKYSTRSKKQERNKKGSKSGKGVAKRNALDEEDDDDDDEDENDETLGGFIVDDEDVDKGNGDEDVDEGNGDEDEEEEFEEDEDDE